MLGRSPPEVQQRIVRDLCDAAIQIHGERSQTLIPDQAVSTFREYYTNRLNSIDKKFSLFQSLATNFGIDYHSINVATSSWTTLSPTQSSTEALLRASERLHQSTQPMYTRLWHPLSQQADGISFLADMRGDLLQCLEKKVFSSHTTIPTDNAAALPASATRYALKSMSESLRRILATHFSVGLLKLERITWEESSAMMLEKVAINERVHPIRSMESLKHRLDKSNRRVFVWTHPSMPTEPLVALHVALCDTIASNINDILSHNEDGTHGVTTDQINATTAVFYSISSMKKGLAGIDLGNNLIKAAVTQLRAEIPSIQAFVTLSPLPGLVQWMQAHVMSTLHDDAKDIQQNNEKIEMNNRNSFLIRNEEERNIIRKYLDYLNNHCTGINGLDTMATLKQRMDDDSAILKPLLTRIAAFYLLKEKHRGRAFDEVSNFHLRNGAEVYDVHWMADTSQVGMERSFGIMVNYRYYDLKTIEENNSRYMVHGEIAASERVKKFLSL